MRIVCPACTTAYDVPKTWLPPGRAVRCARCGVEWVPLAADAPILPAPDKPPLDELLPDEAPRDGLEPTKAAAPFPPAVPPSADKAPQSALRIPLMAVAASRQAEATALTGWVVSLALLGMLAWGGVRWRSDVMRAWPPSERLYAALGLTPGQQDQ